jgi:hypothetical protein
VDLFRRLVAAIRISPEERRADCAERCLEVLCDPERAPGAHLGEHEEAVIEAARRRWDTLHPPASGT